MRMARRVVSVLAVSAAGWLAFGACVTPSDQYDDYIDRTANVRGFHPRGDAAVVEASLPDGGFNALYAATCLPHVTTVDKALRFVDTIVFTPAASGPGGTITATFNSLPVGATNATATVGPPIGPATSPVDATGQFQLDLKNLTVLAAANPISPADVHFDVDTFVAGALTMPDQFCGGLDGTVVSPINFTLDHCDDVCLFVRIADVNAPLPVYTDKSVFVCPNLSGC
jgi:hypothetical protein